MKFLLDTNVVSEWVKPRPDGGVVAWMSEVDEDRVFISVISLAELRRGVERMPSGARRRRLDEWLKEELPLRFEGRVLLIDRVIAEAWGKFSTLRNSWATHKYNGRVYCRHRGSSPAGSGYTQRL